MRPARIRDFEMRKLLLLFTTLFFCTTTTFAQDCDYSGVTGDLQWCLKNGTLTISGNGDMPNYSSILQWEWHNYRSLISTVVIGSGVTSIGAYAFADCGGLTNVDFKNGSAQLRVGNFDTYSGNTVFSGSPLDSVYLGRTMKNYGNSSVFYSPFYNKTTLERLTIGGPNISVTDYAFQKCTGLKIVSIGNEVLSIGNYVFDECYSLSKISLGSVESIGAFAFRDCSALTDILIPQSVNSIGSSAFFHSGLTSIIIPSSIETIAGYAFADCDDLTEVIFVNSSYILNLGDFGSYENNGRTVFSGSHINTLYLGRYMKNNSNFGDFFSPFYNHKSLKTLTIGENMNSITDYAFQGCDGLTQITSKNPAPPTFGTNTFSGVIPTTPVYVPCVLAYQSSVWGTIFSNFFQTGNCPNGPILYTLNVLSSNTDKGHVTSISMSSGAVLTSTWDFEGNISTSTSAQFSGKTILLANAKYESIFMGWEDEGKGNLEPMRIVDIASDKTYTAKFASSVKVEETKATTNISIYPNPAKGKVTVELPENTVGTLALFDLNGKIIRRQSVNGNINTIDIAFLSSGTYILRLVQDGVASAGVKIVKE